ncbi:MFS transporter (plasmid) [Pediococcus pentosaceus]|uniref:MFS transporter n=1 Tax=Pediococcus pentosaceus TaxID=1255 RepID=UPI0018A1A3B3|nr:MFS transporter [Pediococcus pentosaceus]MBF7105142.1 MFS transporter [Pediococcus pentosaceus]MBF7133447.1 MFS transporter [Pediococcus pentosaceus]MCV3320591.1 MFS transporter [Pediococcus pentosaceus]QQC60579.1 MFS transporter [Pediococcus pentosaceus]
MTEKKSRQQLYIASVALLIANLGSSIFSFAMGLFLLRQYSSASVFGISQAIGPVVSLALAPVLRLFIDKANKKRIISLSQILSIIGLITFAILLLNFDNEVLLLVMFILVILRISDQIFDVAYMASATLIVDSADIQKLKSYEQMVSSFSSIIGPIIAAAWFSIFDMHFGVFIIAELVCETLALLLMWVIKYKDSMKLVRAVTEKNELTYIFKDKLLVFAIWFGCAINFFYTIFSIGLPYIQIHVLRLPNRVYALSEAAVSIGMLVTSYLLSKRSEFKHPLYISWKMTSIFSILFLIMGLFLFSSVHSKLIFSIFIIIFNFVTGSLIALLNTPTLVWLTTHVPENMQGRVFNISRTCVQVLMPIGIIIASFSFDTLSAGTVFIISGILFFVLVVLYPKMFRLNLRQS